MWNVAISILFAFIQGAKWNILDTWYQWIRYLQYFKTIPLYCHRLGYQIVKTYDSKYNSKATHGSIPGQA